MVAAALFVARVLVGDPFHLALWIGCGSGLAAMALGGAFQSLWAGDRVEEAEAAGVRLRFGLSRRVITELDARVGSQLSDANRRLSRLESAVFDENAHGKAE